MIKVHLGIQGVFTNAINMYGGWGTTLLGVLGVNSFIGCYQCFPINSIVGLDLAFLIKHYHVISFCLLSSHWCFTRCRNDRCSILPRNHKKPKEQEAETNKRKKKKRETKEPRKQKPQKPEQLSYKTSLLSFYSF